MNTALATPPQIDAMHLSLFVEDMGASVAFYEVLFGVKPTKSFDDYAKFDVVEPPVVFSLQPRARRAGASLSHMGLRMKTAEQVLAVQRRLIDARYKISRQDGVTCGYAIQSKCWVFDPDGNPWEIYVLEQDVAPTTGGACIARLAPSQEQIEDSEVLELTNAGPEDLVFPSSAGNSQLKLRGWPSDGWSLLEKAFLTTEASRISWDLVVSSDASPSSNVPQLSELVARIGKTAKYRVLIESLVPTHDKLLSVRISLSRLMPLQNADQRRHILYRGPMARMVDANGRTWERGVRTPVSEAQWNELQLLHLAKHFSLAEVGAAPLCSTGD